MATNIIASRLISSSKVLFNLNFAEKKARKMASERVIISAL